MSTADIVSSMIALIALGLSIYATWTAREARIEAKGRAATRAEARASLGIVFDEANALLEVLRTERSQGGSIGDSDERLLAWEGRADAAIRVADAASIGKFHEPLGPKVGIHALEERRRRLETILDSL